MAGCTSVIVLRIAHVLQASKKQTRILVQAKNADKPSLKINLQVRNNIGRKALELEIIFLYVNLVQ